MPKAMGYKRFFAWKTQSAFGTKATGLVNTQYPVRGGPIFTPNPYLSDRVAVYQAIPKKSNKFTVPKIVNWAVEMELINPTLAIPTLRDFLKGWFGREVTAAGPPLTKTYDTFDDVIDGGTDGSPANNNYGRAITLHEQADTYANAAIFAHEVQDCAVDRLEAIFEPGQVSRLRASGLGADLQDDQTDLAVIADGSFGGVHTYDQVRNTANSGLRIGTANPPTTSDNVVFARATLSLNNKLRYEPWLGESNAQSLHLATRGDHPDIMLAIVTDVEAGVASQYDSEDIVDHWVAGTAVNIRLLSYISANEIFEFAATAATAAAYVESFQYLTDGPGPMRAEATFKIAPAAITDPIVKLTTVD
jgi:hypothetical protein